MDAKEIKQGRIYSELSHLIRLISPPEEYEEEAAHWCGVLRDKLGQGRHTILELGVGGGHNLSHLTFEFDAVAVDISEAMLKECRKLNPGVELHLGDMRSVRLGKKFAAVLIHDAINYMLNEADLLAAFKTAAAHLNPGGIFITSPERFVETLLLPSVEHATHLNGETQLTYVEYTYDPGRKDSTVETIMFYLIHRPGGLRIEKDRHVTGVFNRETWFRLMEEAGFSVEVRSYKLKNWNRPYELFIGVLR